ncbi:hypothetical protein MPER_00533, partial [Moniliophthora perniciosa FA553]
TGIHWQVSQATSLYNIVFELSREPNNAHQGIWMENGSGGFMGDLVFNGGKFGMWVGNQQARRSLHSPFARLEQVISLPSGTLRSTMQKLRSSLRGTGVKRDRF